MADDVDRLFGSESDEDDGPQQQQQPASQQRQGGGGRLRQRASSRSPSAEPGLEDEDDGEPDGGDEGDGRRHRQQPRHAGGGEDDDEDDDGGGGGGGGRGNNNVGDGGASANSGPPMALSAPLLPVPPPGRGQLLKLTNIVGIEPRPFNPETFPEEAGYVDDTGRRRLRNPHKEFIRWRVRKGPDGSEVRESNARFVRWSDGSVQLLLGDEVLDVVQQDMASSNAYLFVVNQIFQGQAALSQRMTFKPASLSHSKLHARLTQVVDKRHTKVQKVARTVGLHNPEADRATREKMEEEKLKNRFQLQRRQDRVMSSYEAPRPRAGGLGGSRRPQLTAGFLEADDGFIDDTDEPGAYGGGGRGAGRRGMDPDEEEEAVRRLQGAKRQPPPQAKRKRLRDESEDEEADELDGDEEEEEYKSSGEEEDEEDGGGGGNEDGSGDDAGEAPAAGARKAGGAGSRAAAAAAQPKMKARRGVVLSDEEDE